MVFPLIDFSTCSLCFLFFRLRTKVRYVLPLHHCTLCSFCVTMAHWSRFFRQVFHDSHRFHSYAHGDFGLQNLGGNSMQLDGLVQCGGSSPYRRLCGIRDRVHRLCFGGLLILLVFVLVDVEKTRDANQKP